MNLNAHGRIPLLIKSHPRRELCDGLLLCRNHHISFDEYAFLVRYFLDVSLNCMLLGLCSYRKWICKLIFVCYARHQIPTIPRQGSCSCYRGSPCTFPTFPFPFHHTLDARPRASLVQTYHLKPFSDDGSWKDWISPAGVFGRCFVFFQIG